MMNEVLQLFVSGAAGSALGLLFFGGLWWTIRKSFASKRAALWVLSSLLLRMGITLTGFYFVSGGNLARMLACLAGFLTARLFVWWLTRRSGQALQKMLPEV